MSVRHREPYDNVMEMVGWTPLVRLHQVSADCRTPVYGKCEFMSPGGSVKDRIGLALVSAAERDGTLRPGGVIVEATSGNTGLALAMAAATRRYRCIFTMPDKMSQEKVKLLRAFGAEVVITPTAVGPDHPDHYQQVARRIARETPGAVLADQFYNLENPRAHYATTGPELWEQSEGRITHLVGGAGTGGTISGAGAYLKERNPAVEVVGVDPVGSVISSFFNTGEMGEGHPYLVEGLGNDKIPGALNLDVVDAYVTVRDGEAFRMARRLTPEEGLFVGGSSGLNTPAALDLARRLDAPGVFVVFTADHPKIIRDLGYLSMGPGPYYALYRPYHLANIETPISMVRAVLAGDTTLATDNPPSAETVAFAKRNLAVGETIGDLGGYRVYGMIERADVAARGGLLPVGLAPGSVVTSPVGTGEPLTYRDVELDESSPIVSLRRLQDSMIEGGT